MKNTNLNNLAQGPPAQLAAELERALPQLLPSLKILETKRDQRVRELPVDLTVDVVTPHRRKRRLLVDVNRTAVPSRIRETARRFKEALRSPLDGYPVLASNFLSPRTREICREEGTGYLDLAGNCFLQFEDLYLERVVDKNPSPSRGRPPSLFAPVSSRILRVMLEAPERAWLVSELAAVARVSLGQASNVTRRLLDEEYAVKTARRLRLQQPGRLLEAWRDAETFARTAAHAYYSFETDPERRLARVAELAAQRRWRYAVTSFAAAERLAPFVHGIETVQWYVEDAVLPAWIEALGLRPVEAGPNAVLLVPYDAGVFDCAQALNGLTLVGTVQLYLDLYGHPERGREQAEFLRQQKLKF